MPITIYIPEFLREFTGGAEELSVTGNTVGDCLQHLVNQYPGVRERLLDKDGQLQGYVDVFLNKESTYPEELSKPVRDGDELMMFLIISGG